ncbi:recombinase family protein [Brevibacillus sp. SYP-B805]|uniref:recombinase family protein n=1 Tax=Brevibacillus sp. SYP-B805 TaxID=1578199 RepID=UPI0013ED57B3|nr:recombinase family protein [Brevibacillus sp. SYP-B805]NGQ97232.1 recombinase family protein [Brevibacillus sp. SYP-B805]
MNKLPAGARIRRIVSYLRRSREDAEREKRTGEDTIAMQRSVMERVLGEYGIPYDLAEEIGSGDKIESRPVFSQVLADLEEGRYDCIAVKEISRLTRGDFQDYGRVYELIRRKRIFILTPYRLYDPKNVNDLRQIRFEMFLSREEFETIRERMQGAKYAYAMSGRFMGSRPAYGYRTNPRTQRLVIEPGEAEVVRLIYRLYLEGLNGRELGCRTIASLLTNSGIPSPTGLPEWNASAVKKILHNPVYIGEIRYSTTVETQRKRARRPPDEWIIVPNAHPPIISPDVYQQVHHKRQRRRPSIPLDQSPSELSGLIRCGLCGKKMVRQASRCTYRKKDGSVSVYEKEMLWCTTAGCTYVKYRAVEEMLLSFLACVEPPAPERIRRMIAAHAAAGKQRRASPADRSAAALSRQRTSLQKQLAAVYHGFETGVYTSEEFIRRRSEISDQLGRLNMLLKEKQPSPQQLDDGQKERLAERLQSFPAVYHALSGKAEKNRLLRFLIESVRLTRREKQTGSRITPFTLEVAFRLNGQLHLRPPF